VLAEEERLRIKGEEPPTQKKPRNKRAWRRCPNQSAAISGRSVKIAIRSAHSFSLAQLPVTRWHEQIGDPTVADGILDRLVHNAHRIEMRGDSMRKNRGKPDA
jgi:hypothetical protein